MNGDGVSTWSVTTVDAGRELVRASGLGARLTDALTVAAGTLAVSESGEGATPTFITAVTVDDGSEKRELNGEGGSNWSVMIARVGRLLVSARTLAEIVVSAMRIVKAGRVNVAVSGLGEIATFVVTV